MEGRGGGGALESEKVLGSESGGWRQREREREGGGGGRDRQTGCEKTNRQTDRHTDRV